MRLNRPVLAHETGQAGRGGLGAGQARDRVDGLPGDLPGGRVLPPAGDLEGLAGPGEVQAANVRSLEGAGLSVRPCPVSRVTLPAGTCRQGSALIWAYSSGWFRFTKRATDYDVSVPGCRARWWSGR